MEGKVKKNSMSATMIAVMIVYILFSVGGLILFKLGSNKSLSFTLTNGNFGLNFNGLVLVGMLCYIISFFIYLFLVSKFDLSYISPITMGLVQVVTIIGALVVFREKITPVQMIGIVTIIAGIVMVNIRKG